MALYFNVLLCNSCSVSISPGKAFNSWDLQLYRFGLKWGILDRVGWEMKRGKDPISPLLLPSLSKPVRRPLSDNYQRPQKSCLGPQFLTDRKVMMNCGVCGSVSKAVKEKLSLMMKRLLGPTSTPPSPHSAEMAIYNHLTLQNSFSFTLSWLWFTSNLLRSQKKSLEIHR